LGIDPIIIDSSFDWQEYYFDKERIYGRNRKKN
jgi:hypothetical protein